MAKIKDSKVEVIISKPLSSVSEVSDNITREIMLKLRVNTAASFSASATRTKKMLVRLPKKTIAIISPIGTN
jgi:hypothetical protein